jgi:hypothetical protein
MMDSFLAISRQLSAFSSVFFVDFGALGAIRSPKVASDDHSDGDAYREPDGNVAGRDAHRGADASPESNTKDNLH